MNEAKGRYENIRFFDQNCTIEKLHENIDFVIRFPEWKLLLDAYNSSKSLEDLKVVADTILLQEKLQPKSIL